MRNLFLVSIVTSLIRKTQRMTNEMLELIFRRRIALTAPQGK